MNALSALWGVLKTNMLIGWSNNVLWSLKMHHTAETTNGEKSASQQGFTQPFCNVFKMRKITIPWYWICCNIEALTTKTRLFPNPLYPSAHSRSKPNHQLLLLLLLPTFLCVREKWGKSSKLEFAFKTASSYSSRVPFHARAFDSNGERRDRQIDKTQKREEEERNWMKKSIEARKRLFNSNWSTLCAGPLYFLFDTFLSFFNPFYKPFSTTWSFLSMFLCFLWVRGLSFVNSL